MLYLMTNHINIIIIILLTIIIISFNIVQTMANNNRRRINDNDAELYGNYFTAIEFLKELNHLQPTYDDTILIMQNQNATISNIFYTNIIDLINNNTNNSTNLNGSNTYNNATSMNRGQRRGVSVLSEMMIKISKTATTTKKTFVKSLMASVQVPVLQLNELQSFYLKRHYCEHLLSIVYIDINIEGIQMTLNDHKGLLQKLSRNLLHMTTTKVMFLVNFPLDINGDVGKVIVSPKIDEDVIQGVLVQLFQYCWQQKIINVIAILADYQVSCV